MKLWITRTRPEAEETADRVRAMGHEAVAEPVLDWRLTGASIDLVGMDALAFSSLNGVAAFAAASGRRDLLAFTTGQATAKAARAAGFASVVSADGDVEALAALILAEKPGAVLHIGPKEPAGDLVGALRAQGLVARACALYETFETRPPPPPGVDGLIVHSPKAAKALASTLTADQAAHMRLYAISAAAARPLERLKFRHVAVAPYPNEAALLKLIDG